MNSQINISKRSKTYAFILNEVETHFMNPCHENCLFVCEIITVATIFRSNEHMLAKMNKITNNVPCLRQQNVKHVIKEIDQDQKQNSDNFHETATHFCNLFVTRQVEFAPKMYW